MKKIIATVLAMVMALALCTTAFAADDTYDLYLADSGMADQMKLKTGDIPNKTIDEVAAKTNSDGSGNVAYLVLDKNGTAQYAVKTTSPTVSSYAVCKKGETTILYYVNVVTGADAGSFGYKESVKAFTNWGVKCGQVDNSSYTAENKAKDYFTASDGKVYRADDASTTAASNYLLNGEVVSADGDFTAVFPIAHNFVANNFKYDTATGANIPTSAICTKCLTTSTAIYKDGKSPAGATVAELYVNGAASAWEVAVTEGTTPVTPDNGKDSPKTFDAGIAMYVGMALTSVAGSAVVIGKKKEF